MTDRKKLVAGNWKMNGSLEENQLLINALKHDLNENNSGAVDVSFFCPSPYLSQLHVLLKGTRFSYGSQDISEQLSGAYTGQISAKMVREFGATQVIVGHSERRAYQSESSRLVASKAQTAIENNLLPIVCVGETLEHRESNQVESVLAEQLDPIIEKTAAFVKASEWPLVIAYEPVWAIGTGVTASPDQAQAVHVLIRERVAAALGTEVSQSLRILYGGSVKPSNAEEIFSQNDIDGGLIGGASLKSDDFSGIIRAVKG